MAADNALRKTQIVLYRNQPGRGQMVQAVSPAAQLSGAQTGMPLSEAKSLVGRSHQFQQYHVFEHQPKEDLRALQQLALDCQIFSPVIGLEKADRPSSLFMDINGLTHLFGGEDGLRSQIHEHFKTRGYLVATAAATTIGQAWGLVRFQESTSPSSERTAEPPIKNSATGNQKLFDQLPIQALRLSQKTLETLQQLGITTIAQIRHLPRVGLRSRFGDEVTQRLDQADGITEEIIEAVHAPPDYEADEFLEYPLTDRATIQVVMSRLAGKLCRQMKAAGRGGLVWQFRLYGPPESSAIHSVSSPPVDPTAKPISHRSQPEKKPGRPHDPLTIKLFQPTSELEQLMPLVEMQMEALFCAKGGTQKKRNHRPKNIQVQEIGVSVSNCVLLVERQRRLFDENPRLDKQALAHLINRLSSRLGAEQVLRPKLKSGNQPEDQFRFEPLVGQSGRPSKRHLRPSRNGTAISPLQRPLVLHTQPLEMTAVALDGSQHQAPSIPAMFVHDNQRLSVTRRWGPERIETAWWRGPTVRRDYWRIETDHTRWLWVFRNLQNRRWYLHGEF